MDQFPSLQLLRRSEQKPGSVDGDPEIARLLGTSSGKRLVCRVCGETVTREGDRITIEGRHVHRRINPAGFEFEIGCFAAARGAVVAGAPTAEFSWFAGYAWSYSLCAGCGCHLGWHFEGSEPAFHGLILNRLEVREEETTPG